MLEYLFDEKLLEKMSQEYEEKLHCDRTVANEIIYEKMREKKIKNLNKNICIFLIKICGKNRKILFKNELEKIIKIKEFKEEFFDEKMDNFYYDFESIINIQKEVIYEYFLMKKFNAILVENYVLNLLLELKFTCLYNNIYIYNM